MSDAKVKVSRLIAQSGSGNELNQVTEQSGMLVCSCPDFYTAGIMCPHISTVYKDATDAKNGLSDEAKVVLYTDPPTVCTVYLQPTVSPRAPRAVYLTPASNDPNFLGFLHPGEGRLVLRDMVIAYVEDARLGGRGWCTGKYHVQPPAWRTEEPPSFGDVLHVLTHGGVCHDCENPF